MLYFSVTEISTSWLVHEVFCLLTERWKLIWEENRDRLSPPGGLMKHRLPQLHVNRSIGQTKEMCFCVLKRRINTYMVWVFALKFWFVWCCGRHSKEAWLSVHLRQLLPPAFYQDGLHEWRSGKCFQVKFSKLWLSEWWLAWSAFKELSDVNILKETFFSQGGREGMRWTN